MEKWRYKFFLKNMRKNLEVKQTKQFGRIQCAVLRSRTIAPLVLGLMNGLEDPGIGIRFSAEARNFSLLHSGHIGSGAQSASCLLAIRSVLPRDITNFHLVPR
jgi:hypothetical protein